MGGSKVADQPDDLLTICGLPLIMAAPWLSMAAEIAFSHGLSFYDAAACSAAEGLEVPLVSANHALIRADRAQSGTAVTARLGLLEVLLRRCATTPRRGVGLV